MASQHQRAAVLPGAEFPLLVFERAGRGLGAADADAVFFARGLEFVRVIAAGAAAEKEVVVVYSLHDPAELVGPFDVGPRGVLLEVRVG